MNININNKPTDTNATNLAELAEEMNLPKQGVAIALEAKMIQRSEWTATTLSENANIIIIKAACGG